MRRRDESTKKVSVPVSWQSGVPAARARATFLRIVSSTMRALDPLASRRSALRMARSASAGSELEVLCTSSAISRAIFFM